MFDDQPTNGNPPKNLPTEPVDMFEGVDEKDKQAPVEAVKPIPDALSAGLLKKRTENIQTPPDLNSIVPKQEVYKVTGPVFGRAILFVIIAAVLGGLGFGGWYIYSKVISKNTVTQTETSSNNSDLPNPPQDITPAVAIPDNSAQTPAVTSDIPAKVNNDQILFGESTDTDKDGLDNIRETELATDSNNPDTDADGLSDGDEVLIWKTNPLVPDTDGDSYPDGTEVRNGYSPLGPGKLFNVPESATTSLNTTTK